MPMKLSSHFIDLIQNALLKSFWRKKALKTFLKRTHISESFLATLEPEATKREWLDRLFAELEKNAKGSNVLIVMAQDLSEQTSFPDLGTWETAEQMIREAREAVGALREYIAGKKKTDEEEK